MICNGCIGFGCCGLDTVSRRCNTCNARALSPSSMALVSWYDGIAPASPRYGRDVVFRELRARGIRRREHLDERSNPAGVLAEMGVDHLRRVGAQLQVRRAHRVGEHVLGLLAARGALLGLRRLELLGERRGKRAPARDEHEHARVERIGEEPHDGLGVGRGQRTRFVDHDHTLGGHERRAAGGVQHPRDDLLPRLGTAGGRRVFAARRAARNGELLEREAAVVAGEELVDEVVDHAVAQHRIGALDQVDAHADPGSTRFCVALQDRFDHAARLHGPLDVVHAHDATPVGDAVRDRRERHRASFVDGQAEQLAEVALVRRRQQERVPVRGERVALAQQHHALRRRLAEVEAGVERDLVGLQAGGLRLRGTIEEEGGDVADEIVVVRIRVGDPRLQDGCGWRPPTRRASRPRRRSRGRRSR